MKMRGTELKFAVTSFGDFYGVGFMPTPFFSFITPFIAGHPRVHAWRTSYNA